MTEQRYAVPEEGLDAAQQALRDKFAFVERDDSTLREYLRTSIEAFIRWQAEHYDVIPKGDGNAKTDQKSA
jgi:hypothetical protein